ncbi:hypothetical protein [uncultured Nitrosomonas sp.]|uniref:hypothetical protein n=1 Tax=uncultured Nitrosomonas sp. TaxID=156424 RepID=UPI0025FDAFB0|nr:hypothetical protein [uncultured Nitrosomonas sp.]
MNAKRTLILSAIIGIFFLSGCMATPYYGGSGYHRNTVYGYGYQSPNYIRPGYIRAQRHFIGGYGHMGGGHRHFIGGYKHMHRHMNGGHHHRGGNHRRGHHR